MKKSELIKKLQELKGDPELQIMTNGWGNTIALLVHREPVDYNIILMEIKKD